MNPSLESASVSDLLAERERLSLLISLRKREEKDAKKAQSIHPLARAAVNELRRVMRETGITLQQIADHCGIKKQAVDQALRGHPKVAGKSGAVYSMNIRTLVRYADAMNHDVDIRLVPRTQGGSAQ